MKRIVSRLALLACVTAVPAFAAGAEVEQAKSYFQAGAQAYDAGQFAAAIQAFEQAYALAPREAIVFSIAQAYKRQYYVDRNPANLQTAIQRFKEYLVKVPQGGRSADAAQALSELEAKATAAGITGAATGQPAPARVATRLMIYSRTKGARVSIDGKALEELPCSPEVAPGKHRIRVVAEGRYEEERDVTALDGVAVPLDIPMRDKPAELTVVTEAGVELTIDGRFLGTTPLTAPIEVPAGTHLVAASKNGRQPHADEIDVRRGEKRELRVELRSTGQRTASYVVFVAGAGALVTGGVFAAMALGEQKDAQNIHTVAARENIPGGQVDAYNAATATRDRWRTGAGIAFGSAAVLGLAGTVLYAFDHPTMQLATRRERGPGEGGGQESEPTSPSMELSATPMVGPGYAGGNLGLRF